MDWNLHMKLNLNPLLAENYHSGTQIARILTETWVERQMFCPHCGNLHITHFPNNLPVADFYCPSCRAEFELKSKNGRLGSKVMDGAYQTMIERITSTENPDFFFMSYSKTDLKVKDFFFVPKFFFVPEIIERRNPLSPASCRAGWTGCNILIDKIPKQGRISIVSDGVVLDKNDVLRQVRQSSVLNIDNISSRGWLMDILNCVNSIAAQEFSLEEMYVFESGLAAKYPQNHNVRAKIRQQLQFLRDKGFLLFLGNGKYRKCF